MGQTFSKPPLTVDEHLKLLTQRGLEIGNPETAKYHLKFVGYYRLSGYALDFQEPGTHQFKPGTTLDDIIDLYTFDRRLRLHIMDAIERIEVALRAVLVNTLSLNQGAYWYTNPDLFDVHFNHDRFMRVMTTEARIHKRHKIKRQQFIDSYLSKYSLPEMPPSWMILETISIGTVALALKNLKPQHIKPIAHEFDLPPKHLMSWIDALSNIRNLCAHHARLWGRKFSPEPRRLNRFTAHMKQPDHLSCQLFIITYFIRLIAAETQWPERTHQLVSACSVLPKDFREQIQQSFETPQTKIAA